MNGVARAIKHGKMSDGSIFCVLGLLYNFEIVDGHPMTDGQLYLVEDQLDLDLDQKAHHTMDGEFFLEHFEIMVVKIDEFVVMDKIGNKEWYHI